MKLTSTKTQLKYINLLLYGKHGVGKTPLAATAPKPIFIDTDRGTLSIAHLDIPRLEVNGFEDLEKAHNYVTSKKGNKFDTIILDSGIELADTLLTHLENDPEIKDKRQAYLQIGRLTKFWIREFRDIKKNFILTSTAEIIEIGEVEKYRVYFPGNVLKREIPGMFNEIFCLHYEEEEDEKNVVLQCKRNSEYDARDRSKMLKKYEKCDLTYIFNKIQRRKNHGKR